MYVYELVKIKKLRCTKSVGYIVLGSDRIQSICNLQGFRVDVIVPSGLQNSKV